MKDRSMAVTDAARHFADLLNRTYYRVESTVLLRSGREAPERAIGSDRRAEKWGLVIRRNTVWRLAETADIRKGNLAD